MATTPADPRQSVLDDHTLTERIQRLRNPDGRTINVKPLFQLVEAVIRRATQTTEGSSEEIISERESLEGKRTFHGLEEVVEQITREISCKIFCGVNSNETTFSVLTNLESFSWDAKAVLTLAAFAQTYGDFLFLIQLYSTNSLSKSEALIKQVPMIVDHDGGFKKLFEETNNLIRAMLETVRCMVEFMELPVNYITAEDLEVKAAMSHFPIAVYWVNQEFYCCCCPNYNIV